MLPPFAKVGSQIDVAVSSLGDAKSLYGGTLLMTPLKGADGSIYAVAQGAVVEGFGRRGVDHALCAGGLDRRAQVFLFVAGEFLAMTHIALDLTATETFFTFSFFERSL